MKIDTGFAAIVALGVLATALPQQPSHSQSSSSPPTQPHIGRGTVDDVSAEPAAPDGGQASSPDARAKPAMSFEAADKDKDGKVNRREASAIPGLDFARADSNGDSSLSRQEFQAAMAATPPRG